MKSGMKEIAYEVKKNSNLYLDLSWVRCINILLTVLQKWEIGSMMISQLK